MVAVWLWKLQHKSKLLALLDQNLPPEDSVQIRTLLLKEVIDNQIWSMTAWSLTTLIEPLSLTTVPYPPTNDDHLIQCH